MNIRNKFTEVWDNIFDDEKTLELDGEEQFNFVKNALSKNGFEYLGHLKNIQIQKDDIITCPESEDFYSFVEDEINVEKPGGKESRGLTTRDKLPQDFQVWRYKLKKKLKKEMFNTMNLRPNTFVNVKGKGKQYIDQFDPDATNPDNKFGHVAVLIKKGPSDPGQGEWHSPEDLENSPAETEQDRQDIYSQENSTQAFKKGLANQGPTAQSRLKEKNKMGLSKIVKEVEDQIHNDNVDNQSTNRISEYEDEWQIEAKVEVFVNDNIYADSEEMAKENFLKEFKKQVGSQEVEIVEFKASKR